LITDFNKRENKMIVTVRQLENTREMNFSCNDEERLEIARDELKHNRYIRVANFEINKEKSELKAVLNIAYKVTNTVVNAWYENPNLEVSDYAKNGCRSTSIGDIIQVNGVSYMVAECGFIELEKDKK